MDKIAYAKQTIDNDDIQRVVDVLQSPWLTTGPAVADFEQAVSSFVHAQHGVSFNSGTAALHGAAKVLELGPGDEVIVPAMTFVATANAAVYCGAKPVFADVCPQTLLIDAQDILRKISTRTKAIFAVDYAGQPCDYALLRQIASSNRLALVADASHSLGATLFGRHVAQWADLTCYSFHPIKPITTCEGGMVVTNDGLLADHLRQFRNHGITTDHHQRQSAGTCHYDMAHLGFNYRLSDVHCALGKSQLQKLPFWIERRNEIAMRYRRRLESIPHVHPLQTANGCYHGYHLMVVKWDELQSGWSRNDALEMLRRQGIQANVHYRPVYQHSFYQKLLAGESIHCPVAEQAFDQIMSLPIFPGMSDEQVGTVVDALSLNHQAGRQAGHQAA